MGIRGTQTSSPSRVPHLGAGLGSRGPCQHPVTAWVAPLTSCPVRALADGGLPPALRTFPSFHATEAASSPSRLGCPASQGVSSEALGPARPVGDGGVPGARRTLCRWAPRAPCLSRGHAETASCDGPLTSLRSFCNRRRSDDSTWGTWTRSLILEVGQRMLVVEVHKAVK